MAASACLRYDDDMKRLSRNSRYFILIVGVGILVLLVLGFNNRITMLRRLEEEASEVSTDVEMLERTHTVLETQIAYATSAAAVEEWAYEEARMIREGDHLIAPISPQESTPKPSILEMPEVQSLENWQIWKTLFFDSSLP
jgi:cell division protein FtsB